MQIRVMPAIVLLLSIMPFSIASGQTGVTAQNIASAKAEIENLKQDIILKEAQLKVMELQLARQNSAYASQAKPSQKKITVKSPEPASTRPQVATPVSDSIALKANVNPAVYEASILHYVRYFRNGMSSKWLVLDEKRLVYWVLDDEVYLLNLSQPCSGLLNVDKLTLESFSTRVRAGQDSVVLGNQHCLIESIARLGGRSLPKPPKN